MGKLYLSSSLLSFLLILLLIKKARPMIAIPTTPIPRKINGFTPLLPPSSLSLTLLFSFSRSLYVKDLDIPIL